MELFERGIMHPQYMAPHLRIDSEVIFRSSHLEKSQQNTGHQENEY